jgi:hyperosmotically inducible periplasmic protein
MKLSLKLKNMSIGLLMAISVPCFAVSNSVSNAMSDTVVTAKIKSGLAANEATHALNITVETNNGVVTLSGTAESNTEAATAVQIAESTEGVNDVNATNLTVKGSDQPLTDAFITAKVKGVFIKNNLISDKPSVPVTSINVETKEGTVYLSGNVERHSQLNTAVSLTKSVDGVHDVVSTLKVAA